MGLALGLVKSGQHILGNASRQKFPLRQIRSLSLCVLLIFLSLPCFLPSLPPSHFLLNKICAIGLGIAFLQLNLGRETSQYSYHLNLQLKKSEMDIRKSRRNKLSSRLILFPLSEQFNSASTAVLALLMQKIIHSRKLLTAAPCAVSILLAKQAGTARCKLTQGETGHTGRDRTAQLRQQHS